MLTLQLPIFIKAFICLEGNLLLVMYIPNWSKGTTVKGVTFGISGTRELAGYQFSRY
jgi:hypothetical protein